MDEDVPPSSDCVLMLEALIRLFELSTYVAWRTILNKSWIGSWDMQGVVTLFGKSPRSLPCGCIFLRGTLS